MFFFLHSYIYTARAFGMFLDPETLQPMELPFIIGNLGYDMDYFSDVGAVMSSLAVANLLAFLQIPTFISCRVS